LNYAWSHPETGIREQDDSPENARRRVWEALQAPKLSALAVPVFEQEPAGYVTKTTNHLDVPEFWDGYAWANPTNGRRESNHYWVDVVSSIVEAWPENSPTEQVIVYRQRVAFWVKATDPEPAPPAVPDDDSPASLIEQVMEGNCADLNRASLLAQLWMAQSLMEIAGYLHNLDSPTHSLPEPAEVGRHMRRYPNPVIGTVNSDSPEETESGKAQN